jgi:hypothetical protein
MPSEAAILADVEKSEIAVAGLFTGDERFKQTKQVIRIYIEFPSDILSMRLSSITD